MDAFVINNIGKIVYAINVTIIVATSFPAIEKQY